MLKRASYLAAATAAVLTVSTPGLAKVAAPGCYNGAQLAPVAQVEDTEVFIVIDQTTALPPGVVAHLRSVLARKSRAGTRVSLFSFSAYGAGDFLQPRGSFHFEAPPSPAQVEQIGMSTQRNLRQCLANQNVAGSRLLMTRMVSVLGTGSATYSNSDIIGSLRQLGRRIAASRARTRILILASDMIQNMPGNSFYARGHLRVIDPRMEMRLAAPHLANLAGAQVYVVGGGLAGGQADNLVRTPRELDPLERFWRAYLSQSNAKLMEFGTPIASTLLQ